jgi:hypothetical protein
MKQCLLTLSICFISCSLFGQAPNWLWAKRPVGGSYEGGLDVAQDASGNTYVLGYYSSNPFTVGTTTLGKVGSNDLCLIKYDTAGNAVWAKGVGGIVDENPKSIKVDSSGNCYIAGYFESPSISFDAITLTNANFPTNDIFIAKYDASGNVAWAKRVGGTGEDWCNDIALDGSGNCYVTGMFTSSSISFGSTTLTLSGGGDIFVAKYDAGGNVVWAKREGGTGPEIGYAIAADGNGNIYTVATFHALPTTIGTNVFANVGAKDIVLMKFDTSGNLIWAKHTGSPGHDFPYGIDVDGSGNSYVTGYFDGPTFNFGSTTLSNAGGADIFLAKYDAAGNPVWAKGAGGSSNDNALDVFVNSTGQSFLVGSFASSSISFGANTLTNAGGSDMFVASFDAAGNTVWEKSVGGAGHDDATGIFANANGMSFVTGSFSSSSTLFGTISLTNTGSSDLFLAKLSACSAAPLQPGIIAGNDTSCPGISQTYSVQITGGATSYTWTLPSGWTGISTTNSITVNVGSASGNITAAAANACGSSTPQTLPVTVLSAPTVPTLITGDTTPCSGNSETYSVPLVTGATSYTWMLPTGWSGASTTNSITVTTGPLSGNVSVSAVNTCGSSGPQAITVAVVQSPVPTIIQTGSTLSTTGTFSSYQWYFNTLLEPGATNQTYTPTANGIYFVIVTDSSTGCSGQSNILSFSLDIDEASARKDLRLFPNPVKDVLHLNAAKNPLGLIQLYDCLGRKLVEKNADEKDTNLDMRHFPPGLYLLRANDMELKVIKE